MSEFGRKYFWGEWKVIPTDPPGLEPPGHMIQIVPLVGDWVAIVCKTNPEEQTPYVGKYDPKTDRIEDPDGSSWYILGVPGPTAQIKYFFPTSPGDWTAEDTGGVFGGE